MDLSSNSFAFSQGFSTMYTGGLNKRNCFECIHYHQRSKLKQKINSNEERFGKRSFLIYILEPLSLFFSATPTIEKMNVVLGNEYNESGSAPSKTLVNVMLMLHCS